MDIFLVVGWESFQVESLNYIERKKYGFKEYNKRLNEIAVIIIQSVGKDATDYDEVGGYYGIHYTKRSI